jgi:hypothetical protein
MAKPTYLSGDKAGIDAFLDKFDVHDRPDSQTDPVTLTKTADFLVRLRWYVDNHPLTRDVKDPSYILIKGQPQESSGPDPTSSHACPRR